RRMPVVAVLADGQHALRRRRVRAFLRLCANEDRICHQSVCHGDEAATGCAGQAAADNAYLAGDVYTIADIAAWPWYGGLVKFGQYGAAEFLSVHEYKNVVRWADAIHAR